MQQINCYIPIKLRLTGWPNDAQLDQLGETLVRALAARIAFAERAIGSHQVHLLRSANISIDTENQYVPQRRYHVPESIQYSGPSDSQECGRMQRILLLAINNSIQLAESRGQTQIGYLNVSTTIQTTVTKKVKSEKQLDKMEASSAEAAAEEVDKVFYEKCFVLYPLILQIRGLKFVKFSDKELYARSSSIHRAVMWARLLFQGHSFVIIKSISSGKPSLFYVFGISPSFSLKDFQETGSFTLLGEELTIFEAPISTFSVNYKDKHGNEYLLYDLVDENGFSMWLNIEMFRSFRHAVTSEAKDEVNFERTKNIGVEFFRERIFGVINDLLSTDDETDKVKAVQMLMNLGVEAFELTNWEKKQVYLQTLVTTGKGPGKAGNTIVEIFKSLDSQSELLAILNFLKSEHLFDLLFNELDKPIWGLLVAVGERWASLGTIPVSWLIDFLMEVGPLSNLKSFGDPTSTVEIKQLWKSVINLISETVESIAFVLTKPDKFFEALGNLGELILKVNQAQQGNPEAIKYLESILSQISQQIINGLRGAELLDISGKIARKIKWAVIVEAASWFVGVGEVKAGLKAIKFTEILSKFTKIAKVLKTIAKAEKYELTAIRLQRLLETLSRSGKYFSKEDEMLRVLENCITEEELAKIFEKIERVDLDNMTDIGKLELVGKENLHKLAGVRELADKAGGLTDELLLFYEKLSKTRRLTAQDLTEIIISIPKGEGKNFVRAINIIEKKAGNLEKLLDADLLRAISTSKRRMDSLVELGYDTFARIYKHSGEVPERMDQYLDALTALAKELPPNSRAIEYRKLLDMIESGKKKMWRKLEDVRINQLAEQGRAKLLSGNHNDLINDLLKHGDDNEMLINLAAIGELDDSSIKGLSRLQSLEKKGADFFWRDILDDKILHPSERKELLELAEHVYRSAEYGSFKVDNFEDVVKQALKFSKTGGNVKGSIGSLRATISEMEEFARKGWKVQKIHFEVETEVSGAIRYIDIQIKGKPFKGKSFVFDVEVKNWYSVPEIAEDSWTMTQIRRDLIRHVDDEFKQLKWKFSPDYPENITNVQEAMRTALKHDDILKELMKKFPDEKNSMLLLKKAEDWLEQRFKEGLVSTY